MKIESIKILSRSRAVVFISIVAAAMFVANGCEDVIDLPLRDASPQIVIEGHLSERIGWSYFRISRTTSFYTPAATAPVSDAFIIVSDSSGRADTLRESSVEDGLYLFRTLAIQSGQLYTANVSVDGKTYTATTSAAQFIMIDSLDAVYQPGGGVGLDEEEGYRLHVYFQDRVGMPDYARIVPYRNNRRLGDIYLYDGRFSDGNPINYEYFLKVFQLGDTVLVDLYSMNRDLYDYYTTLYEVLATEEGGNGFGDVTPANPNSNWSNGALGYFGAFRVSRETLVVE
jgi:hypothetical protein